MSRLGQLRTVGLQVTAIPQLCFWFVALCSEGYARCVTCPSTGWTDLSDLEKKYAQRVWKKSCLTFPSLQLFTCTCMIQSCSVFWLQIILSGGRAETKTEGKLLTWRTLVTGETRKRVFSFPSYNIPEGFPLFFICVQRECHLLNILHC